MSATAFFKNHGFLLSQSKAQLEYHWKFFTIETNFIVLKMEDNGVFDDLGELFQKL